MLKIILAAAAIAAPVAVHAQDAPGQAEAPVAAVASPALTRRADDVVRFLNGEGDARGLFAQSFLDRAPPERLARIVEAVRRRYGDALGVSRIDVHSPTEGVMHLMFAEREMPVLLQVEADESALIEGLLFQPGGQGDR